MNPYDPKVTERLLAELKVSSSSEWPSRADIATQLDLCEQERKSLQAELEHRRSGGGAYPGGLGANETPGNFTGGKTLSLQLGETLKLGDK
jgi:hypothetical protein